MSNNSRAPLTDAARQQQQHQ